MSETFRHGPVQRLRRLARYRLQIPLKRSRHSPQHLARGVMVGTVWAMTPLFGLQMACVLLTWLAARRIFSWDFSLINGLAWTWTTNALTIVPTYYVCWLTGKVMLGDFGDLTGYSTFQAAFHQTSAGGAAGGFVDAVVAGLEAWGLPLALGCIPWALALGWVAYRLSLAFVIRYRAKRASAVAAGR